MPDETEFPYVFKAGRYLFFAFCALGTSWLIYCLCKAAGIDPDLRRTMTGATVFVTFLALRDMFKEVRRG